MTRLPGPLALNNICIRLTQKLVRNFMFDQIRGHFDTLRIAVIHKLAWPYFKFYFKWILCPWPISVYLTQFRIVLTQPTSSWSRSISDPQGVVEECGCNVNCFCSLMLFLFIIAQLRYRGKYLPIKTFIYIIFYRNNNCCYLGIVNIMTFAIHCSTLRIANQTVQTF